MILPGPMKKVTDPNLQLTREYHGRILKVGKKNFIRIVFPDMPKWWETGHDGIVETTEGWKPYKLEKI